MQKINDVIKFSEEEILTLQVKLQKYRPQLWQYYTENKNSYTKLENDIFTTFAYGNSGIISEKQFLILDKLFKKNDLDLKKIISD